MVPRARRRKMQPNLPMPYYEGATHHRVDGVDVYVDSPMRDLTQRTESVGRALDMFLNGVAFAALKHGYASRAQHARARREIAEFEADVRGLLAGARGAARPLARPARPPAYPRRAAGQTSADDGGAGGDYEYVKAVLEGVRREIEAAQIDRRDPVFLAVRDRYNQVLRESQSFFPRWLTDEDAARAGPPSPEPAPRQTALPRPDVPAGARPWAALPRPDFPLGARPALARPATPPSAPLGRGPPGPRAGGVVPPRAPPGRPSRRPPAGRTRLGARRARGCWRASRRARIAVESKISSVSNS